MRRDVQMTARFQARFEWQALPSACLECVERANGQGAGQVCRATLRRAQGERIWRWNLAYVRS